MTSLRSNIYHFGFSLIEMIVVLAIVTILSVGIFRSFADFREKTAVSGEVTQIVSLISSARERTLSSDGGKQYGVRLEADRVVVFSRIPYNPAEASNEVYLLHQGVSIPTITLSPSGSDFTFQKITGAPSKTGTVVVRSPGGTVSKMIVLSHKGTVSVQ